MERQSALQLSMSSSSSVSTSGTPSSDTVATATTGACPIPGMSEDAYTSMLLFQDGEEKEDPELALALQYSLQER